MKYFSMPSDFNNVTVDRYAELNARHTASNVLETYGNLNPNPSELGTGRISRGLPPVGWDKLEDYVAHSRKRGISFNYTFNSPCTGNLEFSSRGVKAISRFIERLRSAGCDMITLAAPSLIALVRGLFPDMRVAVSTITEVDSVFAAREFSRLGVDRIILNEDILRDFALIGAIKAAVSAPIEAIVNTRCIHLCPVKPFDFNFLSHCGSINKPAPIFDYYKWHCTRVLFRNPAEWMKMPWIRPEDLALYDKVDIFKVIGRQLVLDGDPVRTVDHYMEGSFDGNLIALLGLFAPKRLAFYPVVIDNRKLDGFAQWFIRPGRCRQNSCGECTHCAEYAARAIEPSSLAVLERRAEKFEQKLNTFHHQCNTLGLDEEEIATRTREFV